MYTFYCIGILKHFNVIMEVVKGGKKLAAPLVDVLRPVLDSLKALVGGSLGRTDGLPDEGINPVTSGIMEMTEKNNPGGSGGLFKKGKMRREARQQNRKNALGGKGKMAGSTSSGSADDSTSSIDSTTAPMGSPTEDTTKRL
jgi:hypothetical protein